MALSVNIAPYTYSSSDDPMYMQITSNETSQYGFKYKVEYIDNTTSDTIHTSMLSPNSLLSNGVMFNLHEIMKNYVKPVNDITPSNAKYLPGYKYKVRVSENYLQQFSIIDHEYISPYGEAGKTVIKTSSNHSYQVGDIVYIDITSVTGGTSDTQQKIKDALSGVKVVTDVLSTTKFAIDVPFPASSTATYGVTYYNDLRLTTGNTHTTNTLTIIYGKNTYKELYNPGDFYQNNYTNTRTTQNVTFLVSNKKMNIYPHQYMYVSFLEDNANVIRKVRFTNDTNTVVAYYNCSNVSIIKSLNVNPYMATLTFLTGSVWNTNKKYHVEFLDASDNIQAAITIRVNNNCAIFNDQLIYVDNKGSIQSLAVTLQKYNYTTPLNEQLSTTTYWNNETLINTRNQHTEEMLVNTDWIDYETYKHLTDMFTSPSIWFKEDTDNPRPCIITDSRIATNSKHSNLNRYSINIQLK